VPFLAPLVEDAVPTVRIAGVAALGYLGGGEAGRAVATALRDEEPAVRVAAAEAVAALHDVAAAPIVLARLLEEQDEDVLCTLAKAAGALGIAAAVPRLAELAPAVSGVFQRRSLCVRVAAVQSLAAIGGPEAMAEVGRYRDDPTPEVRAAARQALP
jgi:HEAT repeat protein